MLKDLRYAVHVIAKDRWYAAVAIVALALGIGLNATVFTLVNAVLIRGLPYTDSARLYLMTNLRPDGGHDGASIPDLRDWQSQTKAFTAIAAWDNNQVNVSDDRAAPESLDAATLTANAFAMLDVVPVLGRDFAPADERVGAEAVVIIGHAVWKRRYAEDPAILGKTLRLDGKPATIIGVMPEGMAFPTNTEIWTPLVPTARQETRSERFLQVFGRLRRDSDRAQAQAELNAVAQRLAAAFPDSNKDLTRVALETFNERFNGGRIRAVFLSMLGAVGFVLLIACANVANLQLTRSVRRTREVAVRIALGATRWRVVRQLLVESVLLGALGGVFGLGLAIVGVRLFDAAVADIGKPYWIKFTMDYTVFAYLAAVCVMTGIVSGLAPALQVTRTNVNDVLKEGGRGNAGSRRARWLTTTMVVLELALTLVLLVGAGLMVRSFMKLYTLDGGIDPQHLVSMRIGLPATKYKTPEQRRAFADRLPQRLAAIPGVEQAALTTSVPPFGAWIHGVEVDGRPPRKPGERAVNSAIVTVTPSFFATAGVALRRGRAFSDGDGLPGSETAIVTEDFAAAFFPGEDPIGRRVRLTPDEGRRDQAALPVWRTIVGVTANVRHANPQQAALPAVVLYVPHRQDAPAFTTILVRSRLEAGSVINAVRREVAALDPDQPVFGAHTLDDLMRQLTWPYRVFGSLFAIFALIALVMSAVGLYAVMAYSVTQRTAEIGVRMALGAGQRQVSWLVLRRGLVQTAIGLALGVGGAFLLSGALRSLLVEITPTDPITFGSISVLLTVVALLACVLPARRASAIDPLVALRTE